jgi:excisionase family DNA binding protein
MVCSDSPRQEAAHEVLTNKGVQCVQGHSTAEAAEILGISRSSAFQAANNGQLPVIRIGKRLLVSLHSLEQILGGSVDVGPSESSQ